MVLYQLSEFSTDIKKVESERQTEHSVFINGVRYAWMSSYYKHYKTFDEAKTKLLKRLNDQLERNKTMVEMGEQYIAAITKSKESDL